MADVQLSALLPAVSGAGTRVPAPRSADQAGAAANAPPVPAGAVLPAAPDAPDAASDSGRQALEQATQRIRQYLKSSSATLEFTIDQQSGRALLRIIDPETNQLIRQIPSEEVLAIARAIDRVQGLLLKQQA